MNLPEEKASIFLGLYKKILEAQVDYTLESPQDYSEARDILFEDTEYIDELIESNKTSSEETIDLMKNLKRPIISKFLFYKSLKNYSILIDIESNQVYGVKSLLSPLTELAEPSTIIETVLINFSNTLVCDGLVSRTNITIGKNIMESFKTIYKNAKKNNQIITALPPCN